MRLEQCAKCIDPLGTVVDRRNRLAGRHLRCTNGALCQLFVVHVCVGTAAGRMSPSAWRWRHFLNSPSGRRTEGGGQLLLNPLRRGCAMDLTAQVIAILLVGV